MSPEGYDSGGGRNSSKAILIAIASLLLIGASILNFRNQSNNYSNSSNSFAHTTSYDPYNQLGEDISPLKELEPIIDTVDYTPIIADTIQRNFPGSVMQVIRTTPIEGHYSPYLVVPEILEDINLNFGNTSNFSDFPSLYNKLLEGRIHIISSGSDSSGINFDNAFQQALEQDGDAIVDTLSGRKIKVVVRDDYLAINDQSNKTPAMFWASLDEGGILKLGLFSKSADGEYYHPDFYANQFFEAVWTRWSYRINGFQASWSTSSVNYKEFEQNISHGMTELEAARQTVSGRFMESKGLLPVSHYIHHNPNTGVVEWTEVVFEFQE